MSRPAVFLDRDGVLNHVVMRGDVIGSPRTRAEFAIVHGAEDFVRLLKSRGYFVAVVTNQPDIERGNLKRSDLEWMHSALLRTVPVDVIEFCPSGDDSDIRRKPNPGMLVDLARAHNLDLSQSYIVGDSLRDLLAGRAAGVKAILLQTHYNGHLCGDADYCCSNFSEVIDVINSDCFSRTYLAQTRQIVDMLDVAAIEKMALVLSATREAGGRLFLAGSGGGAGHASHAVCDFRKLCGFEAYCPTDNVSELTARVNDDGWDTSIANWLLGSRIRREDCLCVFSVGGGSAEKNISTNLVNAVKVAKETGASVIGVVGRDGGYTARVSDACVIVPTVDSAHVTPHTESFQALVWHLLVSHPLLKMAETKWESTK